MKINTVDYRIIKRDKKYHIQLREYRPDLGYQTPWVIKAGNYPSLMEAQKKADEICKDNQILKYIHPKMTNYTPLNE